MSHRPVEILTALRRIGFIDKPAVGDHVHMFKSYEHADGKVTIHTGIDMTQNPVRPHDETRIRREAILKDEGVWAQVMAHELTEKQYETHLSAHEKWDLVLPFFREKVKKQVEQQRAAKAKAKAKAAKKK